MLRNEASGAEGLTPRERRIMHFTRMATLIFVVAFAGIAMVLALAFGASWRAVPFFSVVGLVTAAYAWFVGPVVFRKTLAFAKGHAHLGDQGTGEV